MFPKQAQLRAKTERAMATGSTPKTATKATKAAPKTAAKTTTAQKTATAKKTAAKIPVATAQATPTAPKVVVVETVKTVVADAPIKKPELIDRVMAETGMKKKDVKPVVEAMLTVLGKALTSGEELTVPPLGKLMIKRTKEAANATIVTIKLRHPMNSGGGGNGAAKSVVDDEEMI